MASDDIAAAALCAGGGTRRLFDPSLTGEAVQAAIEKWQAENLSSGALARVEIMRRGVVAREGTGYL